MSEDDARRIRDALEKRNDINRMIDEIESTAWFVYGASRKGEGTEPLYKAEDILKICDKYRKDVNHGNIRI